MALINKLEAIGDAIRSKTGGTALLTLDEMPTAIEGIISGGGELPEEAFIIEGDCQYVFSNGHFQWYLDMYKNKITTKKLTNCNQMFNNAKEIVELPFDFNCDNSTYYSYISMFSGCEDLENIGDFINIYPHGLSGMFGGCERLRYLPNFINPNFSRINTYNYSNCGNMFQRCYSLREISEDFLKQIYGKATTQSYCIGYNAFAQCYCLDEIKGLNPQTGRVTGNMFNQSFLQCNRVKDIIFATQDDGTPYTVEWKSQSMLLYQAVGYTEGRSYILNYNSGITADKEVTDDASYQALKDDPDWWTMNVAYSRYNHDSAVRTINSLPDTSAYLASAGGTNAINFKESSGSATDGGAINTLTADEIAVATAKGWTVGFVA